MNPVRVALVLVLGAVSIACDGAERRDAEGVVLSVTRLRGADFAATPAMVEALRATPCVAVDVCKAREVCLAAGDDVTKGLRLKSEVESGLVSLEKGTLRREAPEARALPQKLEEAEALIQRGRAALPACDEHVQALKRKHRI